MEIIRANNSGFCFGVKRALDITEKEIESLTKDNRTTLENAGNIYTCGPLIHNSQVTDALERKGCRIIDSLEKAKEGDTVIVRSHGEPKEFYERAKELNIKLTDTTCPFVSKIHQLVNDAHLEGKPVLIIGDSMHKEVIATNGWCNYEAVIIYSPEEAAGVSPSDIPYFIVCQTTIRRELMESIVRVLDEKGQKYRLSGKREL